MRANVYVCHILVKLYWLMWIFHKNLCHIICLLANFVIYCNELVSSNEGILRIIFIAVSYVKLTDSALADFHTFLQ